MVKKFSSICVLVELWDLCERFSAAFLTLFFIYLIPGIKLSTFTGMPMIHGQLLVFRMMVKAVVVEAHCRYDILCFLWVVVFADMVLACLIPLVIVGFT